MTQHKFKQEMFAKPVSILYIAPCDLNFTDRLSSSLSALVGVDRVQAAHLSEHAVEVNHMSC